MVTIWSNRAKVQSWVIEVIRLKMYEYKKPLLFIKLLNTCRIPLFLCFNVLCLFRL